MDCLETQAAPDEASPRHQLLGYGIPAELNAKLKPEMTMKELDDLGEIVFQGFPYKMIGDADKPESMDWSAEVNRKLVKGFYVPELVCSYPANGDSGNLDRKQATVYIEVTCQLCGCFMGHYRVQDKMSVEEYNEKYGFHSDAMVDFMVELEKSQGHLKSHTHLSRFLQGPPGLISLMGFINGASGRHHGVRLRGNTHPGHCRC